VLKDAGYNSIRRHLPITEVTIKQDENPLKPGSANLTLGSLVCWGNGTAHLSNKAVKSVQVYQFCGFKYR